MNRNIEILPRGRLTPLDEIIFESSPKPRLGESFAKCITSELVVHLKLSVLQPLNLSRNNFHNPKTSFTFYPLWEIYKRIRVGFPHGEVMEPAQKAMT